MHRDVHVGQYTGMYTCFYIHNIMAVPDHIVGNEITIISLKTST